MRKDYLNGVLSALVFRATIPPHRTQRPDVTLMDLSMPVMGGAEATVKVHVLHILSKLGVDDRTAAATVALKRGMIRLA